MNKVFMMLNLASLNALPVMERWLLQIHAPETIARIGPWLTRYQSYRATPPPPEMHAEAENLGFYNWRITELWHRKNEPYPQYGILPQEFFDGYKTHLGLPTDVADADIWHGRRAGPRQVVRCVVPARATEDFMGSDKAPSQYRSILRWVTVFKLPPNVTADEGERWFLDTHAKQVMQIPGLTRFVSHRVIPTGRSWSWHRVSELWFEDFDAWRNGILVAPPRFTAPDWARHGVYPFLEPFVDFASTFLLESPTNTFWPAYGDYLVSC